MAGEHPLSNLAISPRFTRRWVWDAEAIRRCNGQLSGLVDTFNAEVTSVKTADQTRADER